MSVGPLGFGGSVAGSELSQRLGSEVERSKHEADNQTRQISAEKHAEKSAGLGETEGDEATSDRDADGQRIWEDMGGHDQTEDGDQQQQERKSKDPDGESGSHLDISG